MYTNPTPNDQLNERLDAYTALLSAAHRLSGAVLALQYVDAQGDLSALREPLITELYAANDLYIAAYAKVNPKGAPQ